MMTADHYLRELGLEPHIEGGYFREMYKNTYLTVLPNGERPLSSTIYYLLKSGQVSKFHRLSSDELWFYHDGSPLTVHMIDPKGDLTNSTMGLNIAQGEQPQLRVPAHTIFGAEVVEDHSFTLVSCAVSPGFNYRDFEMFTAEDLREMFPVHGEIIRRFNG